MSRPRAENGFSIFNGSYTSAYVTSLILPLDLQSPKYLLSGSLHKNFVDPLPRMTPDKQFLSRSMFIITGGGAAGGGIVLPLGKKTIK